MKKTSKRILSLLLCLVLCVGLLPTQALAAEELPADILAEPPEDEKSNEDEVLPEEAPDGQDELLIPVEEQIDPSFGKEPVAEIQNNVSSEAVGSKYTKSS